MVGVVKVVQTGGVASFFSCLAQLLISGFSLGALVPPIRSYFHWNPGRPRFLGVVQWLIITLEYQYPRHLSF